MTLTPTAPIQAGVYFPVFDCTNTDPAIQINGVSSIQLSASTSPVPDIVALAATLTNDGIVNIPGVFGTGVFAVATVNLGVSAQITVSTELGIAQGLPVTLSLCQTNPTTGACLAPPIPTVTTQINAGATPTFGVFVQGDGVVEFLPLVTRVSVLFKDQAGVVRGATGVAFRTQ